jgi:hypothetical protein
LWRAVATFPALSTAVATAAWALIAPGCLRGLRRATRLFVTTFAAARPRVTLATSTVVSPGLVTRTAAIPTAVTITTAVTAGIAVTFPAATAAALVTVTTRAVE